MHNLHIAHMLRHRAHIYKNKEVFRFKVGDNYKSMSWNTFIHQSEIISKYLISINIGCNDNVGIFSNNMPQWTISDLGILSIRSTVVPIFPTNTKSQLEYVINETAMRVLFVGDNVQLKQAYKLLKQANPLEKIITFHPHNINDKNVIFFNDILSRTFNDDIELKLNIQLETASKDDLASIIYTSGTSGEPKGVMLTHYNFLRSFENTSHSVPLYENDISLCFLPLSHVFERCWSFLILYNGGINVYNENPKEILDTMRIVKPTVMCTVPRLFEKVYAGIEDNVSKWSPKKQKLFNWAKKTGLRYIEYKKDGKSAPLFLALQQRIAKHLVYNKIRSIFGGKIRIIPCSGSSISGELKRFFHAMDIFLLYGYGATETTATVSCMHEHKYDFENTGQLVSGIEAKISEENMILIKGDTIFKGYYKKPEQTAEVLKNGWYYTGDEGCLFEDGTLLMRDRLKDIMKTSTGKMVSPQKIELILSQSPLIEQICVIGDNRKYLSALIVPSYTMVAEKLKHARLQLINKQDFANSKQVNALVLENINELQKDLPVYEKVVKIAILPEPFSIDNSLLTNSLKVRRKEINKVYAKEISQLYS